MGKQGLVYIVWLWNGQARTCLYSVVVERDLKNIQSHGQ